MADTDKRIIKQMARDICLLPCACDHCQVQLTNKGNCQARTYAKRAYENGWRKQEVSDERKN